MRLLDGVMENKNEARRHDAQGFYTFLLGDLR